MTRYPEAVPLRNISAKSVAQALFQVISRVGITKEILTDQGTSFMSRTLRELYELLGIRSIKTSVYHPQTVGLVERFNRTLKSMIRKFVHDDSLNCDKWLVPLLFAVREVPQASLRDFCSVGNHGGCWNLLRKTGKRVPALVKAKFNTLWICEQNSTRWGNCHGRICSRLKNVSST